MSKEENNKAIVGRWFTDFWGKTCDLGIVDELAAPDMLLQYSLHEPQRSPISTSGALRISSRKATTSSVDGKAAERIPGRRSATSWRDRCRPTPAAR